MARHSELRYAIDLPNPQDPTAEMINYDYYRTKKAALAAAQKLFGTDKQGRIKLISKLPPEES